MVKLGINIDHVATLRQQRKIHMPDLIAAAQTVEKAGADGITVHLREDRRHIQDDDVRKLRDILKIRLNLEMAVAKEIVDIAVAVKPDEACIVPEKRQELTTEGGLDVAKDTDGIKAVVSRLKEKGIIVSLFIDPVEEQIECAKKAGADCIELHTGKYASSQNEEASRELEQLLKAGKLAVNLGLQLNAGHGLDYDNTAAVAKIPGMDTLNIGFSIVSRAVFIGLDRAVMEMKALINR